MNTYSSHKEKFIFRYEPPSVKCVALSGYNFDHGDWEMFLWTDSCVSVLIEEAYKLERVNVHPAYLGMNVNSQLILLKSGYGYDVLNFECSLDDGSVTEMELNGKPVRVNNKWKLFVKCLVETHDKHLPFTQNQLRKILKKCGMM